VPPLRQPLDLRQLLLVEEHLQSLAHGHEAI
jgi:hypothetical protein